MIEHGAGRAKHVLGAQSETKTWRRTSVPETERSIVPSRPELDTKLLILIGGATYVLESGSCVHQQFGQANIEERKGVQLPTRAPLADS